MADSIDHEGYRANVGIVVISDHDRLLLAGRAGRPGWQFPQGGIQPDETALAAMYRELREEVGLAPDDVALLGQTRDWIRYRLPERYIRRHSKPRCIGQKQIWFLLRLVSDEQRLCLDATAQPEFDRWRWVDYWRPVKEVIFFKRPVYVRALHELAPIAFPDGPPAPPNWWPRRWQQALPTATPATSAERAGGAL